MSERSRRRCVLRKTALPDASHYVGYVEDEETPEMIMKKFEELERIKAAAAGTRRPGSQQATPANSAGPSSSSGGPAAQADTATTLPPPAPSSAPSSSAATAAAGAQGPGMASEMGVGEDDGDVPLDAQQLQELFKATSMYNIKSLLGNNEALMVEPGRGPRLMDRGPASDLGGLDSGESGGVPVVCACGGGDSGRGPACACVHVSVFKIDRWV